MQATAVFLLLQRNFKTNKLCTFTQSTLFQHSCNIISCGNFQGNEMNFLKKKMQCMFQGKNDLKIKKTVLAKINKSGTWQCNSIIFMLWQKRQFTSTRYHIQKIQRLLEKRPPPHRWFLSRIFLTSMWTFRKEKCTFAEIGTVNTIWYFCLLPPLTFLLQIILPLHFTPKSSI